MSYYICQKVYASHIILWLNLVNQSLMIPLSRCVNQKVKSNQEIHQVSRSYG